MPKSHVVELYHLRRRAARQQIAEHEWPGVAAAERDSLPYICHPDSTAFGGGTAKVLVNTRSIVDSRNCCTVRSKLGAVGGRSVCAARGYSLPACTVRQQRQPPTLHEPLASLVDASGALRRKGVWIDLKHRHGSTEPAVMELGRADDRRAGEPRTTEVGANRAHANTLLTSAALAYVIAAVRCTFASDIVVCSCCCVAVVSTHKCRACVGIVNILCGACKSTILTSTVLGTVAVLTICSELDQSSTLSIRP